MRLRRHVNGMEDAADVVILVCPDPVISICSDPVISVCSDPVISVCSDPVISVCSDPVTSARPHPPPPDPYGCTLQLWVSRSEARALMSVLKSLLRGIDPTFRFVVIKERATESGDSRRDVRRRETPHAGCAGGVRTKRTAEDQCRVGPETTTDADELTLNGRLCPPVRGRAGNSDENSDVNSDGDCTERETNSEGPVYRTPAISIGVFLHAGGPVDYDGTRARLDGAAWCHYHHTMETRRGTRYAASQEYYEVSRRLPLIALSPVHAGHECLRFTVYTRSLAPMVSFYRRLSGASLQYAKRDFCILRTYSQPGFDVQLALKASSQLSPRRLRHGCLHFRVGTPLRDLDGELTAGAQVVSDTVWMLRDPDGNKVLVEAVT